MLAKKDLHTVEYSSFYLIMIMIIMTFFCSVASDVMIMKQIMMMLLYEMMHRNKRRINMLQCMYNQKCVLQLNRLPFHLSVALLLYLLLDWDAFYFQRLLINYLDANKDSWKFNYERILMLLMSLLNCGI